MKKEDKSPFHKLAKPAQRALANANIQTLEQLSQLTETEFMKLHGIGKNALGTLKEDLKKAGLSFKQK
jgi:DNA-directed RNA polymerase alpha subunit